MVLATIYSKDPTIMLNYLKPLLESLHFKQHRRFLYFFKLILSKHLMKYFKVLGCSGFYFRLKGKIGLGGASKKKLYKISIGKHSSSNKALKFKSVSSIVNTLSGVLGMSIVISFY